MDLKTGRIVTLTALCLAAGFLIQSSVVQAQSPRAIVARSKNRPLPSLRAAAAASQGQTPPARPILKEIPNFRGAPSAPGGGSGGPDPVLQDTLVSSNALSVSSGFEGADNEDNLRTVGFRVAPPDTDGDVGPSHIVQMINLVTTIYDKSGNAVSGPFASNTLWADIGGLCEAFNQGDPIVAYDETNDRWLVSQFAFDNNFTVFAQCIAVSQTGDPTGAYNRYEFSFNGIGLPDYPKHGIVTDSITMTANLFSPPLFFFSGTFIAAADKAAMYDGQTATMVGFNLGAGQFGFLPADLDDPADLSDTAALFATAMSRRGRFDIWEIDVDWTNPAAANASRVADVRISNFDADLCGASREACIPQPNGAPALEAISDRLMNRLQIRDFGSHKTMTATHTVDANGNGTAGIRWYEMRWNPNNGKWTKHQEGTYAPGDGLHRWMPSIAMNNAGDIGLGFLVSSSSEPMGIRVTGQTAGASGTGSLDVAEKVCRAGVTEQTGTARSGDYSAMSVDPVTDTFWHVNEYGQHNDKSAGWGTFLCEFALPESACTPAPEACDGIDNDCNGVIDDDPACETSSCTLRQKGDACTANEECCSNKCTGKPNAKTCK